MSALRAAGSASCRGLNRRSRFPFGILAFLAIIRRQTETSSALSEGRLLLCVGLWTPDRLVALALLNIAAQPANWQADILLATMGVALALVGPGAWSVDARLFGWNRIDVRPG